MKYTTNAVVNLWRIAAFEIRFGIQQLPGLSPREIYIFSNVHRQIIAETLS